MWRFADVPNECASDESRVRLVAASGARTVPTSNAKPINRTRHGFTNASIFLWSDLVEGFGWLVIALRKNTYLQPTYDVAFQYDAAKKPTGGVYLQIT
ncbi:jg10537 [Pararge aegeria aegeria]|uniref:Jg10537 protein n=1 Tax=Pararge aegeria aegeria TaxID=348720 RepID=A0A8S4S855_9NEOP|nr:jg10537 [Pararge aegeria aegeria]